MLRHMGRPKWAEQHGFNRRTLILQGAVASLAMWAPSARAEATVIRVGYLRWAVRRPTISMLDRQDPDNGLAGARLAMSDNNTTGRFMNRQFELMDVPVHADDDPLAALNTLVQQEVS